MDAQRTLLSGRLRLSLGVSAALPHMCVSVITERLEECFWCLAAELVLLFQEGFVSVWHDKLRHTPAPYTYTCCMQRTSPALWPGLSPPYWCCSCEYLPLSLIWCFRPQRETDSHRSFFQNSSVQRCYKLLMSSSIETTSSAESLLNHVSLHTQGFSLGSIMHSVDILIISPASPQLEPLLHLHLLWHRFNHVL